LSNPHTECSVNERLLSRNIAVVSGTIYKPEGSCHARARFRNNSTGEEWESRINHVLRSSSGPHRYNRLLEDGSRYCHRCKSGFDDSHFITNNKKNGQISKICRIHNRSYRSRHIANTLYGYSTKRRIALHKAITRHGTKNLDIEKLAGCSRVELRHHLEGQFEPWMNWSNHGEWHIDHICPLNQAMNQLEIDKLLHYKNLRPLSAYVNSSVKRHHATPEAIDKCLELLGRMWCYA